MLAVNQTQGGRIWIDLIVILILILILHKGVINQASKAYMEIKRNRRSILN